MALVFKKQKAMEMRKKGKSYSEIKQVLRVSKSSLSVWLRDMPLSKKRIRELRDNNPRRIENFRNTMRKKREARMADAYVTAIKDFGNFSRRDLFIAGLYLYWGEGTKSSPSTLEVANTDPSVLKTFIAWLGLFGIEKKQLRAKLHLYADMNIQKESRFWYRELQLEKKQFRKPYIKKMTREAITYTNPFKHGTCCVIFENQRFWEYVTMSLKVVREKEGRV